MVSGGCIISGAKVEHSLLFSNVCVESYASLIKSVVLPNVVIGENCQISKAIIDKGCKVPKGTHIGQDLAEDKERFYVSPDGVVLVTPEMLGQKLHHGR